jgi:hypothetical protein
MTAPDLAAIRERVSMASASGDAIPQCTARVILIHEDVPDLLRHVESQAARIAELEARLAEQEPLEDGVVAV